jgi:pilus assembly protein CpaF
MNTGQDGSLSTGHANTPADMLRRLETMVLMTGYELPLRAIREQMSAAVDLIVHTARLKDGSRKIVTITEVLGMDGDEIVTQDIFNWEQTGVEDGRVIGEMKPTGVRPAFVRKLRAHGIDLPPQTFGLTQYEEDDETADRRRIHRHGGYPTAVAAGGMVYVTGVGPVDRDSGTVVGETIQAQTRKCIENLKSLLEAAGTSLDRIVWATWSLRSMSEFDGFIEEWSRWFAEDAPARNGTLVPTPQRQGEFRISIGVIARAGAAGAADGSDTADGSHAADVFAPAPARTPGPR